MRSVIIAATVVIVLTRAARVLKAASGRWRLASIFLAAAAASAVAWAGQPACVDASVWLAPAGDASLPDVPGNASERLPFDQPTRIGAAVHGLPGPEHDGPAAYMVGFAGVGEQGVFAKEIQLAARVIGDRDGSSAHTVLLVNDRRDVDARPLATVAGLERALKAVGDRMDRERDILFLVLSSHGSGRGSIVVSNGGPPLRQLSGELLATALKQSGIRWRVIVISACHAGAFIPSLKDDNTIILTAAAADRTSFGCSDDRELTYFGEALFRDSLPKALDWQDAFEKTRKEIAEREQREGISASLPQAFFGPNMTKYLAQFEAQSARK